MKVALIGDVHANLPALEAVVDHARRDDIEAIWNAGDVVGYGAFPNEVVERLREVGAVSIAGEHDLKVLAFEQKQRRWRKKKELPKFLAFQWASAALTEANRQYLRSLPRQTAFSIKGLRILLTHGSPASEREPLTPDTPDRRLSELASGAQADLVVCGHSHRAFAREVGKTVFVNTGSVGWPDDGDPRACYAVLRVGDAPRERVEVRHERVTYDLARAARAIRKHRLPEAFAQMTIQGRDLNDVMQAPDTWEPPPRPGLPWDRAEQEQRLRAAARLADRCDHDRHHAAHVEWLSLRLFDELKTLHRLGDQERLWLQCGARLHDIGWAQGRTGHHKTSLGIILGLLDGPFEESERHIIGSIARYHRGSWPQDRHPHFAGLPPVDQYRVTILAAILRVADGLDRTHREAVQDVSCAVSREQIVLRCMVRTYAGPERQAALEKGDLLRHVFDRELRIERHVL